ncbi:MAG TPA: DUF1153 domain-containing protein [Allosphingosinicella sp.]
MSVSQRKFSQLDEPVTLANLPPADTERWVARRKAQVVAAVQAGLLSLDDALTRYKLTLEEFTGWQRALYRHGLRGLQVTQLQICKMTDRRRRRGRTATQRWRNSHA